MLTKLTRDQVLGLVFAAFAVFVIFVWTPFDTETSYLEKVRRQITIGDALAPTIAALFLLLGGLGLLVSKKATSATIDIMAMRFAGLLLAVYFFSFLLMLYVGPIAVWINNLISGSELEYRLLRDTAPWKYLGFASGGFLAVFGSIALLEGKLSWRAALTALLAVAAMIAVYDLPFDDLLLPPNGDV